ncbi:MAG TPA: hypothetical protein VMW31_03535, partial [Devosiaceae bacterium]|nr:hypothetical protein [Devosiaceae bacterium]
MADDKRSGPVKPPTIEGQARPATGSDGARSRTVAGARRKAAERKQAAGSVAAKPGPDAAPKAPPEAARAGAEAPADTKKPGAEAPADTKKPGPAAAADAKRPEAAASASATTAGFPAVAVLAGAALGAVLALGIGYALAVGGWWPGTAATGAAASVPSLAAIENRVAALESAPPPDPSGLGALAARLDALETATSPDLTAYAPATELAALRAGLEELAGAPAVDTAARNRLDAIAGRLEALETAPASPEGADGAAVDLARLTARIDALEARPAADSGPALDALQALQARIAALEAAGPPPPDAALAVRVGAMLARIEAMETQLAALDAHFAAQSRNAEAARQATMLPLAIDELERLVNSGGAFAAPLEAVATALPALAVPDAVRQAAATGITPPGRLAEALAAAAPAMLQARADSRPDADLGTRILDQIAAAIALRPEGEPAGDDPAAVLARLESA